MKKRQHANLNVGGDDDDDDDDGKGAGGDDQMIRVVMRVMM